MNSIRFCTGPIKPEDLTEDDRTVYNEHMFVYAAMGGVGATEAWSLPELLNQCQHHPEYRGLERLSFALVRLQEIGMVRTEEAALLDAMVGRQNAIIKGSFTFDDIRVQNNIMSMKFGGNGSRWMMALFANAAFDLMRGIPNALEMKFVNRETNETYLVTTSRLHGKPPLMQKREIVNKIKAMLGEGGATVEQLQALVDEFDLTEPAPGLAEWPDQAEHDDKYHHLVFRGDSLHCTRCLADERLVFPTHDPRAQMDPFIEVHKRCVPSDAPGDLLRALREEKRVK